MKELGALLRQLRAVLEKNHYSLIVQTLTGGKLFMEPWVTCSADRVNRLPRDIADLVKVFHLGQAVDNPHRFLGAWLTDGLLKHQILRRDAEGKIGLGGRHVFPYRDLLLISDRWTPGDKLSDDHLWLGEDSLYLLRMLPHAKGKKVLDLCAGTGIQGLTLAARAAEVACADLNPKACEVALWNIHLNGLEEKCRVFQGDLYEPLKLQKYDLIVSNPPFLPSYRIAGDAMFAFGGRDGLRIVRRILDGLDDHLNPDGEAVIMAGGFGNEAELYFTEELEQLCKARGWSADMFVITKNTTESETRKQLGKFSSFALVQDAALLPGEDPRPFTHYYSYILAIRKECGSPGCRYMDLSISRTDFIKELRSAMHTNRTREM